jgi:hypothetical protein
MPGPDAAPENGGFKKRQERGRWRGIGSFLTFEGRLPCYRLAGVLVTGRTLLRGASKNFLSDSRLAGSERRSWAWDSLVSSI